MAQKKKAPTEEQQAVIDALRLGRPKIEVGSFAGTGKTSLLEMCVENMPNTTKFLYIVFNKSGEREAKERFERFSNITCKTIDALAYANYPSSSITIGFYKRQDVERLLGIDRKSAKQTLERFESFCNGSALMIEDTKVQALWDLMEIGKENPSFSFIKKSFQLNLALNPKTLPINRYGNYDVVMIDEYQDTNPVTLAIANLIDAQQNITVGDKHQSIYGFRGASNVMGNDAEAQRFYLTNSFRFNQQIADKANAILRIFKGETSKITGLSTATSLTSACMLSRTNATLISTIKNLIKNNIHFKTIRDVSMLFDVPMSIHALSIGQDARKSCQWLKWEYQKFKKTNKFGTFVEFLEDSGKGNKDQELLSAVRIVKDIDFATMTNLEQVTNENNSDTSKVAKYFLSTIHTAKGLEWDYVKISDDVPDYAKQIAKYTYETYGEVSPSFSFISEFREDVKSGECDEKLVEEFNLLYVALTRAKVKCDHPEQVFEMMNENIFEASVKKAYKEILEKEENQENILDNTKQQSAVNAMGLLQNNMIQP